MNKQFFRPSLMLFVLAVTMSMMGIAAAQDRGEGELDPAPPNGITVEEIISRFAAKEAEFKRAREQYTYRQSITVQTLEGGTVDGEYKEVYDVLFDNTGKRMENVVFAPQSTLQRIQMTREDFQDIRQIMPFVLTTDEIPEYDIKYAGRQRQDELNTYVFDISPKKIEPKRRYFEGRIWVDDRDLQIVKTFGKSVPDIVKKKKRGGGDENLFPKFTTWREQVDGQYWFPAYTKADDQLHFTMGDVHIRQIIRYLNYQRFGANVKITYEGQDVDRSQKGDQPSQQESNPAPAQQEQPRP